jgi:antirestriction protein ArdC
MAQDIYSTVTTRIIEELEKGVVPWRRPWNPDSCSGPDAPVNAVTGMPYHGINVILLGMHPATSTTGDPRFCTYKQAQDKGWQVRKGEKSTPIVFYRPLEVENDKYDPAKEDSHATRLIGLLRTFAVFHIGTQVDGAPPYIPPTVEDTPWRRPEAVSTIMQNSGAVFRTGGDRAFYSPMGDFIQLPPDNAFHGPEYFAAVAAHEMIHWTGAKHRLDRDQSGAKGSRLYATEELVAETGSAFVGATLNIPSPIENTASYIDHWLAILKADKRAIFHAAAAAQKAADLLLNFHPNYRMAHEPQSVDVPRPVTAMSQSLHL